MKIFFSGWAGYEPSGQASMPRRPDFMLTFWELQKGTENKQYKILKQHLKRRKRYNENKKRVIPK
jgi:hypothetical protein